MEMGRNRRRKRVVDTEAIFTAPALVKHCLSTLQAVAPLESFTYILEPSAGDGAFLRELENFPVTAIDIQPRSAKVQKADFFYFEPPNGETNVLILGNPPFGRRGSLAMRFLNRAMQFGHTVAFILPRSFKKHTFLNRVDRRFRLIASFDCSEFVLPDGTPREIKCVFQVWRREGSYLRELVQLADSHEDFEMKHFHLSRTSIEVFQRAASYYDFAIAQVGSDFSPKIPDALSSGSYWFIKVRNQANRNLFYNLDFSFLDGMNTAHKSLSKRDIIQAYQMAAVRCACGPDLTNDIRKAA